MKEITEIPTTDEEVADIFHPKHGENEIICQALHGIYRCYRKMDGGKSVEDAFKATLENYLKICDEHHGKD